MTDVTLKVRIPANLDALAPIVIADSQTNLHAAFIERYCEVPEDMNRVSGFYLLLSSVDEEGHFTAYLGSTSSSYSTSVYGDLRTHPDLRVGVLCWVADGTKALSLDEKNYLMARLAEAFDTSEHVTLRSRVYGHQVAQFASLVDTKVLDRMLAAVVRVLALRGYRNQHLSQMVRDLELLSHVPDEETEEIALPLLNYLQDWRAKAARDKSVAPQALASNRLLENIAAYRPRVKDQLAAMEGVTPGFVAEYGDEIVKVVAQSTVHISV